MNQQEAFEQFHRAWSGINAAYEQYARKIGISYAQLQVLCELYHAVNGMTQKAVCDICHLPKTTVNAIISGLVKEGSAVLFEVPEDRRQKKIVLTEKGRAEAVHIMEHMQQSEQQAFAVLDEETVRGMLQGIETYQKNFQTILNGGC